MPFILPPFIFAIKELFKNCMKTWIILSNDITVVRGWIEGGNVTFCTWFCREWLRPGEEHLVQRFDPSSRLDTIGFFIAKFSVGSKDSKQQDHPANVL